MEARDYASIVAVVISVIAFILSLRRERRASQESLIKAFQGDKEAVMYVAYKACDAKWRKQLQNQTFRDDVTTAMGLAWAAESSDRAKALIFAALRQLKESGYSDCVCLVLNRLNTEFTTYQQHFASSDFQKRIDAIQALTKALQL